MADRPVPHDAGFVEVDDRCWLARSEFLDVNVGLVGGERGLLVVDTNTSEAAARRVVEQVRRLGVGEVVAIVNTHQHFDHTFGNVVFAEEYDAPPVFAHESVPADLEIWGPRVQAEATSAAEDPQTDASTRQRYREIAETRLRLPDRSFSSAKVVDLGDRRVELVHPGRGHTAGDVVVRVAGTPGGTGTDVLFAGDLVEESTADHAAPGYGDDCFPLEWPATLDLLVGLLTPGSLVLPGHGQPVSRDFVEEQRTSVGVVAETIRDLASRGIPAEEALDATQWPFPKEALVNAVGRGYAQLPRGARRLPLA
ncbi:MAG: MBL fold metallo-hydrolase [Nocardioidaceae bacterium]